MDYLRNELDEIKLNVGDIIVDHLTGYVGVLLNRDRHIDIIRDDVYFWEIKWATTIAKRNRDQIQVSGYIEEETLQLSILVGSIELYCAEDKE
jgi:hypothetical protein